MCEVVLVCVVRVCDVVDVGFDVLFEEFCDVVCYVMGLGGLILLVGYYLYWIFRFCELCNCGCEICVMCVVKLGCLYDV